MAKDDMCYIKVCRWDVKGVLERFPYGSHVVDSLIHPEYVLFECDIFFSPGQNNYFKEMMK